MLVVISVIYQDKSFIYLFSHFKECCVARYFLTIKYSAMILLCCLLLLIANSIFAINSFGIVPRATSHLSGILFAPFLHANWMHLLANSFPFIVLSTLIGVHSVKRFWVVFGYSIITSGSLVWLLARGDTLHVGMSGVIYAMWGYLIVYGIRRRQFKDILISIIVLFIYGSLVFGVLPQQANVSFESHLFGALAGALFGYLLAKRP